MTCQRIVFTKSSPALLLAMHVIGRLSLQPIEHMLIQMMCGRDFYRLITRRSSTDPFLEQISSPIKSSTFAFPINPFSSTMSFGLEKRSGKKIFMLRARKLGITWGENANYWYWRPLPESRFSEVAELLQVWWFDILGSLERRMLSEETTYGSYLVFKESEVGWSGFDEGPIELILGVDGISESKYWHWPPRERDDGWMEIEIGDFFNNRGSDGAVEVRVRQLSDHSRKSGILIQGIEFRPKQVLVPV